MQCRGQQGEIEMMHPPPGKRISILVGVGLVPSSIENICSCYKERKCARKIFIVFVTLSNLKKTSSRAVNHTYKIHEN